MAEEIVFCAKTGRRILVNGDFADEAGALTIKPVLFDDRSVDEICDAAASAELASLKRAHTTSALDEIVFCARTGQRIVADNVIPFPRQVQATLENDDI
ncbi:hypothetical protein OOJ09_31805 [Mesorhizobium qingshengii]|uniref:Uncharacterized protein n=1 Tax=Mesorhizobium qingshengii TaxID=1165689 RepID=A0ABT4R547_9HYPH|nr:hypothetical protein [Mesorhizobium qingshengii]MCZ8548754.1 hypothetical protein [Mesorhizobium qingshengii]